MQVPPEAPEWMLALPQGDYLRALRLLRAALDETQPISYANDLLIYMLQASSSFTWPPRERPARPSTNS